MMARGVDTLLISNKGAGSAGVVVVEAVFGAMVDITAINMASPMEPLEVPDSNHY